MTRVAVVALVAAAAFGAGDQYLGSLSPWRLWTVDVSLLSAPWLALPFVAGYTQRDPRRAALLGLGCTVAGLLGYGLMTLSPFEGAHLTVRTVHGFVVSERPVLAGGLVTGPLFGWLGQQWRVRRAWLAPLAVAAALCFEPVARAYAGRDIQVHWVAVAEVAVGCALVVYVAVRSFSAPSRLTS
jgi:hypothetical protein